MHRIPNSIFSVFCCFGHQDSELNQPATLQNLPHRDSPASAALPRSSIPDITTTNDDLQRIFASTATPGGYNAANTALSQRFLPKGSLDLAFQFGAISSPTRKQGSLEQLSTHLKEKLSKHGSSNSHLKDHSFASDHLQDLSISKDENKQLLSMSQRSTGLTDLLASRAASQGGYDSDAQSLRTPILRSSAGTVRISPAFIRKSLKTIRSEESEEFALHSSNVITESPCRTSCAASHSSPLTQTPTKQSFLSALEIGSNESPSDALRRISTAIENGTIRAPDTPDLSPQRMSTLDQGDQEWRLSMSAPKRVSSLGQQGQGLQNSLSRLRNSLDVAKRDSFASSSADGQTSLLSDIDPGLIEYLERHTSSEESNHQIVDASPLTAIRVKHSKFSDPESKPSLSSSSSEDSKTAKEKSTEVVGMHLPDGSRSVHLLDMKISQRLASDSQVNSSASGSKEASSSSLNMAGPDLDFKSKSPTSLRYPTFIANEPNRRPSDPRTRKLFEDSPQLFNRNFRQPSLTREPGSLLMINKRKHNSVVDDSSSVYSSFTMDGSVVSPSIASRKGPLRNSNSIAVGGRSASMALPMSRFTNATHTSNASEVSSSDEVSKYGRRSVSFPLRQRPNQVQETPTPKARKIVSSIDRNERMSYETLTGSTHQNVNTKDIGRNNAEDQHNEELSEIDYRDITSEINLTPRALRRYPEPVKGVVEGPSGYEAKQMFAKGDKSIGTKISTNDTVTQNPRFTIFRTPESKGDRAKQNPSFRSVSDDTHYKYRNSMSHARKRSQSTGDLDILFHDDDPIDVKHKKSLSALSARIVPMQIKAQAILRTSRLKKISIQSLGRKPITTSKDDNSARTKTLPPRKGFGIWTGLSAHRYDGKRVLTDLNHDTPNRGSSLVDNMDGCLQEQQDPLSRSMYVLGDDKRRRMSKDRINRKKAKSMNFTSFLEGKTESGRKGLAQRLRRLYVPSGSDLKTLRSDNNCRSTLSLDESISHVAIESSSENSANYLRNGQVSDGEDIGDRVDCSCETSSEAASDFELARGSTDRPTAADWGQLYADCVGSLSALRSDTSINTTKVARMRMLSLGSELRDSTIDFNAAKEREMMAVKARLLQPGEVDGVDDVVFDGR